MEQLEKGTFVMFLVSENKIVCPYCRYEHEPNPWTAPTLSILSDAYKDECNMAIICGKCRRVFALKIKETYEYISSEITEYVRDD